MGLSEGTQDIAKFKLKQTQGNRFNETENKLYRQEFVFGLEIND